MEVSITESRVCSVAGFAISGFETPNCVAKEIVTDNLCLRIMCCESGRNGPTLTLTDCGVWYI